jgi:hypothetical protein
LEWIISFCPQKMIIELNKNNLKDLVFPP